VPSYLWSVVCCEVAATPTLTPLHYVCFDRFMRERNKEERDIKEISYFFGLDEERNKVR
jgi:hypothetical protein